LPADNAFEKSIHRFLACLNDEEIRKDNYKVIERQSSLVEQYNQLSK